MAELLAYVPDTDIGAKIVFNEELAPVVSRIARVLPKEVIWSMYSSTPSETGGKINFPYSRIDTCVIVARDNMYLLTHYGDRYSETENRKTYDRGCAQAFEALVWVEIGFEGLQNLAKSSASLNWTSGVGHTVTPKQREEGIMTTGREMYMECLSSFKQFRESAGIHDDYFGQYGVEYLLDTIEAA